MNNLEQWIGASMIKQILYSFIIFLIYIPTSLGAPSSWTVTDTDTTIILYGTFHLGTPDTSWLTNETLVRLEKSDRLYLELAPEQMTPEIMGPIMAAHGLLPQNQTLLTILPASAHQNLESYMQSRGIAPNSFDRMRPWLASMVIGMQEFNARGFSGDLGAEKLISRKAINHNIPIYGLETAEGQMSIFSALRFEDEVDFLAMTLNDMKNADIMIDNLITAWKTGNDRALDELMNKELSRIPGLVKTLLHDRNENWVKEISKMMKEPGYFFVAVGAGHLVGNHGVPTLLKNAGHGVLKN